MSNKLIPIPSESLNSGVRAKCDADLSKGFSGRLYIETVNLSFCSVTIQCVGTTASGSVELKQGSEPGNLFSFANPITIPLGNNTNAGAFDIPVSGGVVGLDISGASWGTTGRAIIYIVAKQAGGGQAYMTNTTSGSTPVSTLLFVDGNIEIHDNITTGGSIPSGTCVWCKVENIGSGVAFINGTSGQIQLQPGESFYEEMQLLDKIYRQAQVDYNPNGSTTLRITKKLIA